MKIKLNDSNEMPIIAFGVYQIEPGEVCEQAVLKALEAGYRSIDTAQMYRNEESVGNAITKSSVPRSEIFLTTKVWLTNYGYEETIESIERSLKRLQTDYIDLVLLHQPFGEYRRAFEALVALKNKGVIKSIGVSNFYENKIADLCVFNKYGVIPAVNQIEINPFFQREDAVELNKKYGVVAQAWAPFAEGKNDIFNNKILKEIGSKYNKSVAQVILRWLVQRNIPFAVKSVSEERIKQNFDIFDFKLSDQDMTSIKTLDSDASNFFNHETGQAPEMFANFIKEKNSY